MEEQGIKRPSVRMHRIRLEETPDDERGLGVKEIHEHRCNCCNAVVGRDGHDCPKLEADPPPKPTH